MPNPATLWPPEYRGVCYIALSVRHDYLLSLGSRRLVCCYPLMGPIRAHWCRLRGGKTREAVDAFFRTRDQVRSTPMIDVDFAGPEAERRSALLHSALLFSNKIANVRLRASCSFDFNTTLLQRSESLTPANRARPHGALCLPDKGQVELGTVREVRVQPKREANILDVVLKDKVAIIPVVKRDRGKHSHVAITLSDKPGRDVGLDRLLGHRFFARDEIELLALETAS